MKRSFVILFLQILVVVSTPSILLAQLANQPNGRLVDIDVPAPALTDNLLETPDIQSAAIYLPPGYDQQLEQRYPVVYLLHGIFDDHGVWTENYQVPAILDRLIFSGYLPELIVVMPNGGNKYRGGNYRNSPVSGNWGDYIADDLIGYVDGHFRTLANKNSRAVIGHSMGGYGALNLAITRPGVFSVVWALSPCCLASTDDLSFGNDAWRRAAAIGTQRDLQDLIENRDFYPVAAIGIVTAFSPDVSAPPIYGDFPIDIVRGEVVLDELAYDQYLDALPSRQVRAARKNLRELRGLALGVGLGDQFLHIPTGTLEFSQRLGEERIPHLLDVYDGDHRQRVGERLESTIFPWVAKRLSFAE